MVFMNTNRFEDFCLDEAILRAVREQGYRQPTDIQTAAIPQVLAGKDVLATAQTGTGKTAAFCLPMLDRLHRCSGTGVRGLVLTPTRELAMQVESDLRAYGSHLRLKSSVVLGGIPMNRQIRDLRQQPAIVVATPGRLLDLLRQKHVRLDRVEMLVLDEADRMLDMGFIQDVRLIVSQIPKNRQTLLFSATLSAEVKALASGMLREPVSIATTVSASVAAKIDQKVLFVDQADKASLLVDILRRDQVRRALVFTRTKHRADRLMRHLSRNGIRADAIHSNKSQNGRQRSLAAFDEGHIRVLVATDIVARGIDVEGISHVINYELPNDASSYVHRVGRTARAGSAGIALSFCDATELTSLTAIEKLIRHELPSPENHVFRSTTVAAMRQSLSGRSGGPVQWRSFGPRKTVRNSSRMRT
jgi:ATP-dependent RNA helicase RhlE